jgi:hypothetical protein
MFNKIFLAYVPKEDVIAGVVSVNLLEQTVELKTDEENLGNFPIKEVVLLQEVAVINEVERVFDHDVLSTGSGELLLVDLQDNGKVVIHKLNDNLEVIQSSSELDIQEKLDELEDGVGVEIVASFFDLEVEDDSFDFNVKIVKDYNGEYFTYFYALNNKATKEIDLIAVSFVGDVEVEGQEHERRTISYEVFTDSLEARTLVEVSNQEFANFIVGVFGDAELPTLRELDEMDTSEPREEQVEVEVEDTEVGEPTCKFCQNSETACDCEPW